MGVIDKNMVVTLHYTLRDGGPDAKVIEDTLDGAPLTFNFGVGQMIPGFEKQLKGKSEGDNFNFLLAPGEAYGDTKINSVVDVPLSNFKDSNGNIDEKTVTVGQPVRMKNQNGQSFQGLIIEANDKIVKVDFNHPMAGRSLHFSGKILEVKEPNGLN